MTPDPDMPIDVTEGEARQAKTTMEPKQLEQEYYAIPHLPHSPNSKITLQTRDGSRVPEKSVQLLTSVDNYDESMQAVFSNASLLERILSKINKQSLLLSMRVNKTFRDTIARSITLMCQLWMVAPMRPDRCLEPVLNPFITHFGSRLAIQGLIRQERGAAIDYKLRFTSKKKLAKLGDGTWKEMMVFRPNNVTPGRLIVQVETEDTPCVYDIFPVTMEWSHPVQMGALVDML